MIGGIGAVVAVEPTGDRGDEARAHLRHIWRRSLAPGDAVADAVLSPSVGNTAVPVAEAHGLWEEITREVTLALIRSRAGELLMFHAGAVCSPGSGRSLVFVAASQTGKTTLAAALGGRFGYLSDELVAIDGGAPGADHLGAELRVLPYPKPLSVRSDDGGPRREICPDDLGLLPAHPRPTLARLAILNRDPHLVGQPLVEEVPLFEAIVELAPQMSSLGAMEGGLQRLAGLVERTGPVLRITYAESASLAPVVDGLLAAPGLSAPGSAPAPAATLAPPPADDPSSAPPPSDTPSPAPPRADDPSLAPRSGTGARVRALPAVDRLVSGDGGEALFLYAHRVVRLSELGLAVAELAAVPRTLGELTDALVRRLGAPPSDPRPLVEGAVAELVGQGVLGWQRT